MSAYLSKQNEIIYIGEFQEPYLTEVTITAEKSLEYLRDIDKNNFAVNGKKYKMVNIDNGFNWQVIESEYTDKSSLGNYYSTSETKGSAIHRMIDAGFTVKVNDVEITKADEKNNNFFNIEMMYRFINQSEPMLKLFKIFSLSSEIIIDEIKLKKLFQIEEENLSPTEYFTEDEYIEFCSKYHGKNLYQYALERNPDNIVEQLELAIKKIK